MASPNIIIVDGKEVRVHGRVEFGGTMLSVPSSQDTTKLVKSLQPKTEGGQNAHMVYLNGQELPSEFLLHIRASRKISSEG